MARTVSSPTIRELICGKLGLKYCCLWAFFTLFRRISGALIAARLGVSRQAVNRYRADFDRGCFACEKRGIHCMKRGIRLYFIRRGQPRQHR